MINPCGKFQFNRENFEKFMELYCKTIIENESSNKEVILGIAEKPNQHYMPVLADFDIKIQEDNIEVFGDHIYSEDHVKQVIGIYQTVLREIVEDCTDKHLACILLEKPIYYITNNNSTYSKNGFHLHFCNCFLSKVDQEVHLFPRVKERLINMRVFEDLGIEDSSKVFDTCTCKVPWLLYGSRKSEKMDAYKVTKVFDANCEEIGLEEAFDGYELFNMHEELIDIKGNVEYYLPRILSIIPYNRETCELKSGLPSPLKDKNTHSKNARKSKAVAELRNRSAIERDLKISEKLLPMLAQHRCEDFNEWMTIGWILYNVGEGCEEALEQWIEFSARDEEKFDESRCIMEWDRMVRKDLTLGSLRHYAKTDNPDLYNEFKHEEGQKYVIKSLDGSHHDIAKLLYEEFGTEFICSSITNKCWYQFRENKWEEIEEGKFLRDKISDEVVQKFVIIGGGHFSGAAGSDKAEERFHQEKIKQSQRLIANLKNSNYKSAVMRECCDVFYNRFFKQKLDTNAYLIAFTNGVYDLKLNIFRPGKPEDFLSKCMPIPYTEFEETDNRLLEVYDFLEKIFPDKSVRQYFMDQASDIFVGGNHQKVVLFWTGEGDNGKSVMMMMFEKMLGELYVNFPTTLFTGKKVGNGAANPDLARAGQGVRLAVACEPDGDEQINIGILKSLSGNDPYLARDLFEKGKNTKEVSPLFKLYFICNKLPNLKYSDKATWNRIRVVPFESTFVRPGQPCPDTYEEQMQQKRFPMDPTFANKIPHMIEAFAWILLQHRQKITTRVEPEKVRQATMIYQKMNDSYRQFIEENIVDYPNAQISLAEMYAIYKEWFKEGFPGHSLPVKNDLKEYFTKLWGEPGPGTVWIGRRQKGMQDEIVEGKTLIVGQEDLVDYDAEEEN
jgi:P4 family phage/plasmid primase-like protien